MEVLDDQYRAFHEMDKFRSTHLQTEYNTSAHVEMIESAARRSSNDEESNDENSSGPNKPRQTWREYLTGVHQYFWIEGHGRWLAATAIAWWALDIAFYALSLNSPQMVSKLWYQAPKNPTDIAVWNADFDVVDQDRQIYTILKTNSWHALVVTSSGALIGGLAMIYAIEHVNRRKFLIFSFVALGVLFLITGPVYVYTVFTDQHGVIIVLYILCELIFYFGPNTLTFVYPAEIFATPYRATCHGISAAAGKLGSLIIQLILAYVKVNGHSAGSIDSVASEKESNWLGWALMIFSLPMFLGAAVSWWGLPEVQDQNRRNLTLETVSAQPARTAKRDRGAEEEGEMPQVNGNASTEMRQR
jgi:MFS transporter, PHS family, inorganic phosphate transporter